MEMCGLELCTTIQISLWRSSSISVVCKGSSRNKAEQPRLRIVPNHDGFFKAMNLAKIINLLAGPMTAQVPF